MTSHRIQVAINIAYDDFLPYYEGRVKDVVTRDIRGVSVRFPANALQPYLTHVGVSGVFELQINDNNKLLSCKRIGDTPSS